MRSQIIETAINEKRMSKLGEVMEGFFNKLDKFDHMTDAFNDSTLTKIGCRSS